MEDVFDSSPKSSVIQRVDASCCENDLYLSLKAALELPPQDFWNLRMTQAANFVNDNSRIGSSKSAEKDFLLRFVVLFSVSCPSMSYCVVSLGAKWKKWNKGLVRSS